MQEILDRLTQKAPRELGGYTMPSAAESYNKSVGKLTGYDCPKCMNRGYSFHSGDYGEPIARYCDCMELRRARKRMESSGLMGLIRQKRFDTFETQEDWQRRAKLAALAFIDMEGSWFFVSGRPGTGKTHLCTAICGAFIDRGVEVHYMPWREEAPRLKANVNERAEYEKHIGRLKTVPVLYIDDLFKGSVKEADLNLAFELINSRYNRPELRTVISTEKSLEAIMTLDEAIGSRIYERSRGFCVKAPTQNRRLRAEG